jgi:hypothetical protein
VGASKEHTLKGAMFSELQKRLGLAVEARSLPLGDVLWIWRNEVTGEAGKRGKRGCGFVKLIKWDMIVYIYIWLYIYMIIYIYICTHDYIYILAYDI